MFASVKEERTVIGGVELARKTVVAATDQGIITSEVIETRTAIDLPGVPTTVQPSGAYFVPMPALPAPQPVVSTSPRSSGCDDGCTGDCWLNFCFKCDNDEDWYSLNGKGFVLVILLLLGYLFVGSVILAYFALFFVLACLATDDDDDKN
ncbi:hypothetical protein OS493_003977 [Desmophyllum pertusum]|uniref:Transmembrane protein n=1 Tax=Desmophyllum pertusum TaxID=174260 RepID=A0A9X0D6T0_9CNID|nr:hypothetical protein OS493_003977 [Desmophyllum pertusum]